MATSRAPTPSTEARSQASTVIFDNSGRGTSARTSVSIQRQLAPTSPTSQGSDVKPALQYSPHINLAPPSVSSVDYTQSMDATDFQPYRLLLETEISLVYGKKLKESRIIHQELLCCHSTAAQALFKRAQPLREAYPIANELRKKLKKAVYPQVSSQEFEENHMEHQVCPHIVQIYEKHPLSEYLSILQNFVDDAIVDQFTKHNVVGYPSKTAVQKKDLKDMGIQPRLKALTSKGVFNVATHLSAKLRKIKLEELRAAETSKVKAAAQRRIILRDCEDAAVRSLTHWIYSGGQLIPGTAEHLYALQVIAADLGITALMEQCLGKLVEETETTIRYAIGEGLKLQHVLGWGAVAESQGNGDHALPRDDAIHLAPQDNTVQVVFQHVLKDPKPPQRLIHVVIQTLARHLDLELWAQLEHIVSHQMSMNLNRAMIMRRQVKTEEEDHFSVNPESMLIGDEGAMLRLNKKVQT